MLLDDLKQQLAAGTATFTEPVLLSGTGLAYAVVHFKPSPSTVELVCDVDRVNEGSDVPLKLNFKYARAGQSVTLSAIGDQDATAWGTVPGLTTSSKTVTVTADGSYVLHGSIGIPNDKLTEGEERLELSLVDATNELQASGSKSVILVDTSTTPVPDPVPVTTPTVTMSRLDHGNTIDEGTRMATRFVVADAPSGAVFEVTADNSPLSEADFVFSLATDAQSGLPAGVTVNVTGRKVLYKVPAGSCTIDLIRPIKNDLTSEAATEQYNLKIQNITGLTLKGSSTISNWVRDSSRSPDYVPPPPTITPSPLVGADWHGVNHAGAEFATAIYPRTAEINWVAQKFKNKPVVRFAFKMVRALKNGSMLATELDPTFVKEAIRVIKLYNDLGFVVMLDDHSYGRFGSVLAGDGDYNAVNCKRWWRMIADQICVGRQVIFDLQNEPHDQNADKSWAMQVAAYHGIRESGHQGHCIFAHTGWAGISQHAGALLAFLKYTAGLVNVILGFHSYPDKDSAGTVQDENLIIADGNVNIWVDRWTQPVLAARAAGVKLWIGEFGAGVGPLSIEALKRFRAFIDANSDVITGYTWWATGPWKTTYVRAIGADKNNAQLEYLV